MRRVISVLSALATLHVSLAMGQQIRVDEKAGLVSYGTYQGGEVDAVDLQSGNLNIRIPLFSLPQKGKLTLSYSILFNSSIFRLGSWCPPDNSCQPVVHRQIAPIGPRLVMDQQLFTRAFTPQFPGGVVTGSGMYEPLYEVLQVDGGSHRMMWKAGNYKNMPASDGSGYQMRYIPEGDSVPDCGINAPSGGSLKLLTPEGLGMYQHFNGCNLGGASSIPVGAWVMRDRHGNQMDFIGGPPPSAVSGDIYIDDPSQQQGEVHDSLNRTIPAFPTVSSTASQDLANCPNLSISNQPVTGVRIWNVPGFQDASTPTTYYFCYTTITFNTYGPELSPSTGYTWSGVAGAREILQSVKLPNGTFWGFEYNSHGPTNLPTEEERHAISTTFPDLVKLYYPTGGTISYLYGEPRPCDPSVVGNLRYVYERKVGTSSPFKYRYNWVGYGYTVPEPFAPVGVTVTDPDGNETLHEFTGPSTCTSMSETAVKRYSGTVDSTNLLSTETKTYANQELHNSSTGEFYINNQPSSSTTQLKDGNIVTKTYTYPAVTQAVVAGCTDATPWQYYADGCYIASTGSNIQFAKPSKVVTADGIDGTTSTAITRYDWQDAQSNDADHANDLYLVTAQCAVDGSQGASTCDSITPFPREGSWSRAYYNTNGDQISASRYDTDSGWIGTTTDYNAIGSPTKKTDARNNETLFDYNQGDLPFPTKVTRPSTNGVAHADYYGYQPNTGAVKWHTDSNGAAPSGSWDSPDSAHTTTYTYDAAGRLTDIKRPSVTEGQPELAYCYSDLGGTCFGQSAPANSIYTKLYAAPHGDQVSHVTYDSFGRESQSADAAGAVIDKTYDNLGRLKSVTNPHIPESSNPTDGTTTFTYDALGRRLNQQQPDGSNLTWSPSGDSTVSSDETGRQWTRTTNGKGQLIDVYEPNPGSGTTFRTHYTYDPIGNLKKVEQYGDSSSPQRIRNFTYDSLSRLMVADNPEAGPICYGVWNGSACNTGGYDGNGNLVQKRDARNVYSYYSYDELDRLVSVTYSDGTPSKCYIYDGVTNGNGLLSAEWTQAGSCASTPPSNAKTKRLITQYDGLGRVREEKRCILSKCTANTPVQLSFKYDLANNLREYNNGVSGASGFSLTNHFDSAGRLDQLSSGWNAATPTLLWSVTAFTPAGAAKTIDFGSNMTTTRAYDSRLRITESETKTK